MTQRQAAELLSVHVSANAKFIARGKLTPRAGHRPSLSRNQVLELAAARSATEEERARRRARREAGPQPPDNQHEWLPVPAAAVLGCTVGALSMRANRGRVPFMVHDGRRWFRLDHLELIVRADAVKRGKAFPR